MATRRECREWALQLLFQLDLNPAEDLQPVFRDFWANRKAAAKARQFTEELVGGVRGALREVDALLANQAENWELNRMGTVERNVLRMAVYEIAYRRDIPAAVSINEAVDIAKYFSSGESGRFVNGILDQLRKNLKRPSRE